MKVSAPGNELEVGRNNRIYFHKTFGRKEIMRINGPSLFILVERKTYECKATIISRSKLIFKPQELTFRAIIVVRKHGKNKQIEKLKSIAHHIRPLFICLGLKRGAFYVGDCFLAAWHLPKTTYIHQQSTSSLIELPVCIGKEDVSFQQETDF